MVVFYVNRGQPSSTTTFAQSGPCESFRFTQQNIFIHEPCIFLNSCAQNHKISENTLVMLFQRFSGNPSSDKPIQSAGAAELAVVNASLSNRLLSTKADHLV